MTHFFKLLTIVIFLQCSAHSLNAMEHEEAIFERLEQYPSPSFRTGWFAGVLCCHYKRERVHNHAIREAEQVGDHFKVNVLDFVYDGYFQIPQFFWCGPPERHRSYNEKAYLSDAVRAGRPDLVALLLAHGSPPNTCVYSRSIKWSCNGVRTPLMSLVEACAEKKEIPAEFEHVLKLLIDGGAQINQHNECCRQHGITFPLKAAIKKGNIQLCKLLIKHGADIDAVDREGKTLLQSQCRNIEKVALVLSLGADANCGHSVLVDAYRNGYPKELLLLLLAHGACIDGKDVNNNTVFHVAVHNRAAHAIEWLLPRAQFTRTKSVRKSKKFLVAALCAFTRLGVAKDIRSLLVTYFPEYVFNSSHCKYLLDHGVALEALVPYCPTHWFKDVYQKIVDTTKKDLFLKRVVLLVVECRLERMQELLGQQWLGNLSQMPAHPPHMEGIMRELLDPLRVAQYKEKMQRIVTNAILGVIEEPYRDNLFDIRRPFL